MANEVTICNLALAELGATLIESLSERQKSAQYCKLIYETARDAVLRDHDWSFARSRQQLALLSDQYPGFSFAYQYPTNCLKDRSIWNDTDLLTETEKVPYEISSSKDNTHKVILTNHENAILIYTAKIKDPNVFDQSFIDALKYRLASDLAVPLKGDVGLKKSAFQMYQYYIGLAKANSANEGQREQDTQSSFTRAR